MEINENNKIYIGQKQFILTETHTTQQNCQNIFVEIWWIIQKPRGIRFGYYKCLCAFYNA